MLMDSGTFETHQRYGVRIDHRGKAVGAQYVPDVAAVLTQSEREVYSRITAPGYNGPLRVEQERIRLDVVSQSLCG